MPKLTLSQAGEPMWSHDFQKDYITIGRHSFADVPLDSSLVSRHHAVIRLSAQEGGFVVEDAGSSNGVRLNGEEVHRGLLKDGDRIQVGGFLIEFEHSPSDEQGLDSTVRRRAQSGIDEGHQTFQIPRPKKDESDE